MTQVSGGFGAAGLPGQATRTARAVNLWVEKNPVPPPNRRALDCSVVLAVRSSAARQYSGKFDQNFTRAMPGLARVWNRL